MQTCTTADRRAAAMMEDQLKLTGQVSTEVIDGSRYPSNIKSRGSMAPFAIENSHEVLNFATDNQFVPENHFN